MPTFSALQDHHENLSPFAQILLVKKLLDICLIHGTPLSQTITDIWELHHHITTMGPIDDNKLLVFALLYSMGDQFAHLQSAVQTLSSTPGFDSTTVIRRIKAEENLIQCRTDSGLLLSTQHTALTATSNRPPQVPCSTCKRLNHSTKFCISPGGKLAGKTIEEACTAQATHHAAQAAQ
jgi:hypothetical protein